MKVAHTIEAARAARAEIDGPGLVPTMGYLHAGHMSLIEQAIRECGAVAVSIFVNPTQFAPGDDLARYPRDLPRDLEMLEAAGVSLVFAPEPGTMYPPGFASRVEVGAVAEPLEGAARPGHFAGVATVVAKLFNILQPTRAYFGQKDAQQAVVIARMARDLDFACEIVIAPTVREADGLALSSRNVYLSPDQRPRAAALHHALLRARALFAAGERDGEALRAAMREVIAAEGGFTLDYVSVADPETLVELDRTGDVALASLAAKLGVTRLIDNLRLD